MSDPTPAQIDATLEAHRRFVAKCEVVAETYADRLADMSLVGLLREAADALIDGLWHPDIAAELNRRASL